MLTEKEKNLIQRYCLYPTLGLAFIIVEFPFGGLEILLVMINDIIFYGEECVSGFFLYLGITAIYLIAGCICLFGPFVGVRSEKWDNILDKADASMAENDYSAQASAIFGAKAVGSLRGTGGAADALSAVGTVFMALGMANNTSRHAKTVATILGVEIPKAKKYILSIVILPFFLLLSVYVPHYISAKQATNAQIAVASDSVYALQTAFEGECYVLIDDPQNGYAERGYDVYASLDNDEDDSLHSSSINVTVNNDGAIDDLFYVLYIDVQADKDENLAHVESDLRELNRMLNDSGVEAISDILMDTCELPEDFTAQFQENSYYEEFHVDEGESITAFYVTDSEEEYQNMSYSSSSIYLNITPKN